MAQSDLVVVPIERLGHLTAVTVEIGGGAHRFLIDSGIGLTVVSPKLAASLGVAPTGESLIGRRMSGQTIESPLVRLPDLAIGNYRAGRRLAAVADLGDDFAGILGPDLFAQTWWSIDTAGGTLTVGAGAVRPVSAAEVVVPLEARWEGRARSFFAPLVLPSGRTVTVEVDTGSGALILDTRFMADLGVGPDDVETTTGTDETGHEWVRRWATATGGVHLAAAPETVQPSPRVMFQDIIQDGLVGADYLDRFRYTFDLASPEMVLAPVAGESLSDEWRGAPRCPARPSPRRW